MPGGTKQQPENPQAQPTRQFISQVSSGPNVEARMQTLLHGWLSQAQTAQKEGATKFGQWIGAQTAQVDNYVRATIDGVEPKP